MARTPYDSTWRKFRLTILDRDNHRCTLHLDGCTGKATDVDHIVPLSEGGRRLDPANTRASCSHCNGKRNRARQTQLANHARTTISAPAQPSDNW